MSRNKKVFIFAKPWASEAECYRLVDAYRNKLDDVERLDPSFRHIVSDLQDTDFDDVVQHVLDTHLRAVHLNENDWLFDWDLKDRSWAKEMEAFVYTESVEDHVLAFSPVEYLTDDQHDLLNSLVDELAEIYAELYMLICKPLYKRQVLQILGDHVPNSVTYYELDADIAFEVT